MSKMTAYAIMVEDIRSGFKTISQEAYGTLEAAQRFCENRSNVEKLSDYLFVDRKNNIGYDIQILRVI
ncbi:MAG: hypothetical protein MJ000_11060 [Bacteroidales bacterium]|nr:hypothetical protein [Bacteroidales bacterium]